MENELETPVDEFADITLNLDRCDDDTIFLIMRKYIESNMSPASLSKFDTMLNEATLDEAVFAAVFNDAIIQILESDLQRDQAPLPPFAI